MTAADWVRSNLPTKGDADDDLPGNGDEVVLKQGKNLNPTEPDGVRTEHVQSIDHFTMMNGDLINDYQGGKLDKATFLSKVQARAKDPSTDGATLNNRDPEATNARDWSTITEPRATHTLDCWSRWDSEGRL